MVLMALGISMLVDMGLILMCLRLLTLIQLGLESKGSSLFASPSDPFLLIHTFSLFLIDMVVSPFRWLVLDLSSFCRMLLLTEVALILILD